MILYLTLTTIKREQKHKVLKLMDSVLTELMLLVLTTLLTGESTHIFVRQVFSSRVDNFSCLVFFG